jgi:hypothetical protein
MALRNLRNKLRIWYLWLRNELKSATSKCEWCGTRGAYPCGLAKLATLCEPCATLVCCAMEGRATKEQIGKFVHRVV